MTPADRLNAAMKAERLAEVNHDNYELYEVLKHRACMLKLEHAKSVGVAAEKIIISKYGNWIFDDKLRAKAMHFAIMEKYGIDAEVSIFPEGLSLVVKHHNSASTLLKAFMRFGCIMKADAYNSFTLFIPASENLMAIA